MAKELDNIQYAPEVTYNDESNSYYFNDYDQCDCENCKYFKFRQNFEKLFFYGLLFPLIWLYSITIYCWKYYIQNKNEDIKISLNFDKPNAFEVREYNKNNVMNFNLSSKDFNFVNNFNESYDSNLLLKHEINNSQKIYGEEYLVKKICEDAFYSHEKLKQYVATWAFRSLCAFCTYTVLIVMVVLCATSSTNKTSNFF
ncbi:hypothetical protein HANVADRAFT_51184 [Hanseniaspora valbyensis NRRL Y-1626]|uniref:Uncharacterized protein n=1 Tax=Hanseniaspora valbyensis NRRL Y-1626 TaxID=766949 RepID=A0A1B7TJ05_9ASCO|nr:hypothetical protein HANVADRAFT_51184 [Hanseniaspora valbyensis NRRL Y-1626]